MQKIVLTYRDFHLNACSLGDICLVLHESFNFQFRVLHSLLQIGTLATRTYLTVATGLS
jgi:hypothetical protein